MNPCWAAISRRHRRGPTHPNSPAWTIGTGASAELDRQPDQFRQYLHTRDGDGGAIGASLLAFDEAPTAMAVILMDGTIIKVNRELRELLGYDEGELVGASSAMFSIGTEEGRTQRRDELTSTGALHRSASQLRRKDGSIVDVISSAVVVRDRAGEPCYMVSRTALAEGTPQRTADEDGSVAPS